MQAYGIAYRLTGSNLRRDAVVDAKSLYSAWNKLARKHKVDRNSVILIDFHVIGYF